MGYTQSNDNFFKKKVIIWLENSRRFMPFQCSVRQAVVATLGFATAAFTFSLVYSLLLLSTLTPTYVCKSAS